MKRALVLDEGWQEEGLLLMQPVDFEASQEGEDEENQADFVARKSVYYAQKHCNGPLYTVPVCPDIFSA